MKDKIIEDGEDGARGFLDHIEDCIRGALSPENSRVLTPENKGELERALYRLRPSFDELAKWFIDPLRETEAMYGYEKLYGLLAAAFVGEAVALSPIAVKNISTISKPRKCVMLVPAIARKLHCMRLLLPSAEVAQSRAPGKRRMRFWFQ
jgi:hypothetical protein